MTIREKVINYIELRQLGTKSREHYKTMQRFILFKLLTSEGMTRTEVGKLFNRDHSTVSSGLKKYAELQSWSEFQKLEQDVIYSLNIEEAEFDITLSDDVLADKILGCKTYYQFLKLKEMVGTLKLNSL